MPCNKFVRFLSEYLFLFSGLRLARMRIYNEYRASGYEKGWTTAAVLLLLCQVESERSDQVLRRVKVAARLAAATTAD